jgi:hypothetical protein
MRRLALPLGLVLGLLVTGSALGASRTAFTGEWIGNDPAAPDGDGSVVHLYISGGTHAQITFTDEYGTVCEIVGSPVTEFTSNLTGTVYDDDALVAKFHSAHCGPVPLLFLRKVDALWLLDNQGNEDASDDTLDDGSVTWHRA